MMATTTAGYFQITAKVEEINDASFERTRADGKPENVQRIQFSLVVPGMRDRVLCELPLEAAPSTDQMERWELDESWVVVSAGGMRALAFERSNARAGEKPVAALVVFQGLEVREASADERRALQQARKAQKLQAKQRRAQRQAEHKAAKALVRLLWSSRRRRSHDAQRKRIAGSLASAHTCKGDVDG